MQSDDDLDIGAHDERWKGPIASAHSTSSDLRIYVCYRLDLGLQAFATEGLIEGRGFKQETLLCTSALEDPMAHVLGANAGGSLGEAAQLFGAIATTKKSCGSTPSGAFPAAMAAPATVSSAPAAEDGCFARRT